MRSIGFRVESTAVHWAVVEGDQNKFKIIEHARFAPPKTYDDAQAAKWIKDRVAELIQRLEPDSSGIRFTETYLQRKPSAKSLAGMLARARIEGVVTLACAEAGLIVRTGPLQQINSRLSSQGAKQYIKTGEFRGVSLKDIPEKRREAVTVAVSALGEVDGTDC